MADGAQPPLPSFPLTELPPTLVHAILALLPADARARCAAVSRAWRTAVYDPQVWKLIDLTSAGGVTTPHINPIATLRCLAPRMAQTRVLRLPPVHGARGQQMLTSFYDFIVYSNVHLWHTPKSLRCTGGGVFGQSAVIEHWPQAYSVLLSSCGLNSVSFDSLAFKSAPATWQVA